MDISYWFEPGRIVKRIPSLDENRFRFFFNLILVLFFLNHIHHILSEIAVRMHENPQFKYYL